ncbi:hypothetical protein AB0D44_34280, partial [Streptomyces sp. NPDC048349]
MAMTGCAGDVLGAYLRTQATAFLRGLRLHEEWGSPRTESGGGADAPEAVDPADQAQLDAPSHDNHPYPPGVPHVSAVL